MDSLTSFRSGMLNPARSLVAPFYGFVSAKGASASVEDNVERAGALLSKSNFVFKVSLSLLGHVNIVAYSLFAFL